MSSRSSLMLALALAGPALAAPKPVVVLEDPSNDGYGPGTYVKPLHGDFQQGDFDLRKLVVSVDGNEAVFEVTLDAPIRRPEVAIRDAETEIPLDNNIFLQNIDIYIDSDPNPASGFDMCIPGRQVAFTPGQKWETAIVLTPQPGPTRNILEGALKTVSRHIYVAQPIQRHGRTLIARVPLIVLGGPPQRTWGYSVQLSGAAWDRSFDATRRVMKTIDDNAFTMEVLPLPEAYVLGGATQGHAHPRVMDVILPPGMDQRQVLSAYDEKAGKLAQIPFVYPAGNAPPPPSPEATASNAAESAPAFASSGNAASVSTALMPGALGTRGSASVSASLTPGASGAPLRPTTSKTNTAPSGPTVADVNEELISIANVPAGVSQLQIARVVDDQGATLARIMVMQLSGTNAVAQIIDGRDKVTRGAKVSFGRAGTSAPASTSKH